MGWYVQKALEKLSLGVSVPRLGNVLPALEEQPLMGAVGAMQVILRHDFGKKVPCTVFEPSFLPHELLPGAQKPLEGAGLWAVRQHSWAWLQLQAKEMKTGG